MLKKDINSLQVDILTSQIRLEWEYPNDDCLGVVIVYDDQDYVSQQKYLHEYTRIKKLMVMRTQMRKREHTFLELEHRPYFITVFGIYDQSGGEISPGTSDACQKWIDLSLKVLLYYDFYVSGGKSYIYLKLDAVGSPGLYTLPALRLEASSTHEPPAQIGIGTKVFTLAPRSISEFPSEFLFEVEIPSRLPVYARLFFESAQDGINTKIKEPPKLRFESRFFRRLPIKPTLPESPGENPGGFSLPTNETFEAAHLRYSRSGIPHALSGLRTYNWTFKQLVEALESSYKEIARDAAQLLAEAMARNGPGLPDIVLERFNSWQISPNFSLQAVSILLGHFWPAWFQQSDVTQQDGIDWLRRLLEIKSWHRDVYQSALKLILSHVSPEEQIQYAHDWLLNETFAYFHELALYEILQGHSPADHPELLALLIRLINETSRYADISHHAILAIAVMPHMTGGESFNQVNDLLIDWAKRFASPPNAHLGEASVQGIVRRLNILGLSENAMHLLKRSAELPFDRNQSWKSLSMLVEGIHSWLRQYGRDVFRSVRTSQSSDDLDRLDAEQYRYVRQFIDSINRRADVTDLSSDILAILIDIAAFGGDKNAVIPLLARITSPAELKPEFVKNVLKAFGATFADEGIVFEWMRTQFNVSGHAHDLKTLILQTLCVIPTTDQIALNTISQTLRLILNTPSQATLHSLCLEVIRDHALWGLMISLGGLLDTVLMESIIRLWSELPHPEMSYGLIKLLDPRQEGGAEHYRNQTYPPFALILEAIPNAEEYRLLTECVQIWKRLYDTWVDDQNLKARKKALGEEIGIIPASPDIIHNRMISYAQEAEKLRMEQSQLLETLKVLRDAHRDHSQELDKAQYEYQKLDRHTTNSQTNLQSIETRLSSVRNQLRRLRRSTDASGTIRSQIQTLESQQSQLESDRSLAQAGYDNERNDLAAAQSRVTQAENALNETVTRNNASEMQFQALERDALDRERSWERLKQAEEESQTLKKNLDETQRELKELSAQASSLYNQWQRQRDIGANYNRAAIERRRQRFENIRIIREKLERMRIS